jgi:small nuclear ribonucleoprotein (snRNP)-like protein
VLQQAVRNHTQVLISLRNDKKLLARVKAFDRHSNMVRQRLMARDIILTSTIRRCLRTSKRSISMLLPISRWLRLFVDVDRDSKRQEQEASEQGPFYQQDVLEV